MSRIMILPLFLAVVAVAKPDQTPALAVPADSLAFASLDVAKLWEHPSFLGVREARGKLEFAWVVQSLFGVAPQDMVRLTAFWHSAAPGEPFVLITGRKNLDAKAVAKSLERPGAKPVKAPANIVTAPGSEFPYLLQVDARTVLLAPASADPAKLEKLVGMKGRLAAAIQDAGSHTLTIGIDVAAIAGLPLPVGGPLLQAETAILTADLGEKSSQAELRLAFAEASQATKAAPFLKTKLDELAGYAAAQEKKSSEKGQVGSSYPAPLLEWIGKTLKGAKVKADGKAAVATTELKLDAGFMALMNAVPDSAFASRGSSAAENNMKQIMLAMHNYASANQDLLPTNVYDKDGKAILSWRVQLLPYIEQDAVYRQFKLDEAWDSPNNKPLSELAIKVYQVPGRPAAKPWETYFRGFIGPKDVKPEHQPWLTEGKAKGMSIAAIPDGTSNTILVAEAAESVPWAKPDDLPYDGVMALPKLGGPNGTWIAGMGDGSVRTFRRGQLDEKTLRFLISVADGNVVNIPDR